MTTPTLAERPLQTPEEFASTYFDVALYVDQETKFKRLVALIAARDAEIAEAARQRALDAMFDNLPREVMVKALVNYHVSRGMVPYAHAIPVVDEIIAAARKEILGHD